LRANKSHIHIHSHALTETLAYIVYTLSVNCKYKAFRQRQKKYALSGHWCRWFAFCSRRIPCSVDTHVYI